MTPNLDNCSGKIRKAVKAGVTAFERTQACPYGTSAKQFAFMVKYGMSPMQAFRQRRRTPPISLAFKEVGSIAPGHTRISSQFRVIPAEM